MKSKFTDIYLVVVKANSNWEYEEEREGVVVIPMSDSKHLGIIIGNQEEGTHQVYDKLKQFEGFRIPKGETKFSFKNGTEETKSFLVFVEGK